MRPNDLVLTPTGLRFLGRHFPCTIGRNGLTNTKKEGDRATPRGIHHITGLLYRPDRILAPTCWAQPIKIGDLWSDDSADPAYNQQVKAPYAPSHEHLRRSDPLYDLIFLTDWNWPKAVPDKGSAIFLHQYRRKGAPTEGCIAFRRDHLYWIASRLHIGTRLIVR